MNEVNQGNIMQYQEKTSYFVKYSCIWIGLQALQAVGVVVEFLTLYGRVNGAVVTGMLLIPGVWAALLVWAFLRSIALYSATVDQSNAGEYKTTTECLGCYYLYFLIVAAIGFALAAASLSLIGILVTGAASKSGESGAGAFIGIMWLVFGILAVIYSIPVGFNTWLYCMYKNHAKPLIEFYETVGGGIGGGAIGDAYGDQAKDDGGFI